MVYELIIIGCGVILRISQYLFNRSLWIDESSISLEIVNKSFVDLFKPLNYQQSAPAGFLILEKISVILLGINELALRFTPLIISLASIWLFYLLSKKILRRTPLLIGLFLFCFSDILIYYSSEVKPYSIDVFVGLTLHLVFIGLADKKNLERKHFILLTLVGLLSIFFSQPSIFILSGIGIGLLFNFRDKLINIYRLIVVYFIWVLGFITNFYFFLRLGLKDSGLKEFWADSFFRIDLGWFNDYFLSYFYYLLEIKLTLIVFILFMLGGFFLAKKRLSIFISLFLPLVFTLFASFFRLYPFAGRFLLFLAPAMIIFVSFSLGIILETKNLSLKILGFLIVIYFGFVLALTAVHFLIYPRTVEEIRPVVKYYQTHKKPGDSLYLYYGSKLQFQYYSQLLGLKVINVFPGIERTIDINRYIDDINRLRGKNRAWFLFSHVAVINNVNEQEFLINYLNRVGKRLDYIPSQGAAIYLYDLR